MNLSNLISPNLVDLELKATDKVSLLNEMVGMLAEKDEIKKDAVEGIVSALMSREELGSTGIGKGVAVPHAKHEGVPGLVAAFGISKAGIDFSSLDDQPVHIVFLLLSSKESSGQHLEALARVAKLVRDDRLCSYLRDAKDRKELMDILADADAVLNDIV